MPALFWVASLPHRGQESQVLFSFRSGSTRMEATFTGPTRLSDAARLARLLDKGVLDATEITVGGVTKHLLDRPSQHL